jgi:hypothetical protein
MAATSKTNFCGQVSAAPGLVGFPDASHQITGFWMHQRGRKGSFHALSVNSLACGCNGRLDGALCGPDQQDPSDPLAVANSVCFSGVGEYAARNGRRTKQVAYRVVVDDRGSAAPAPGDGYHIQIWIPKRGETADGLAQNVGCTIPSDQITVRTANVSEGGSLVNGDVRIRPKRTTLPTLP